MRSRLLFGSFSLGAGLVAVTLVFLAAFSGQKAAADPASDGYWQRENVESKAGESLSTNCYQTNASGGPGSITFTNRFVCGGEWNGTSTGTWSDPPQRLIPGTRMEMTLSGRATASNNGITQGLVLAASFNAAPCKYARSAVNIAELSLVSHDPARQSGQITGSAVVPGKTWASDVAELGGRLKLNVCAPGWVTYYHYRWVPGRAPSSSQPASEPTPAGTSFTNPKVNGIAIDNCATWGRDCGQGGADLYCRSKGFERANGFQVAPMHPTLVLGDGKTCDNNTCVGISNVTCTGKGAAVSIPPSAPTGTTFANPKVNGIAVDNCATWGSNCGQGGADLYCRSKGFDRASGFQVAPMHPTLVLGDGKTCNNNTCVGFSNVTCTGKGYSQPEIDTTLTYSTWDSFTPDPRQFVGQSARYFPLRVKRHPNFRIGEYDIYIAIADPDGTVISTWRRHSRVSLGEREKWAATFYDRPEPHDLYLEKDAIGLQTFSPPVAGHAMIYARNTDRRHWRAICVLPAGSGMTVREHCFGGTNKIIYIPSQEAQGGGIVAAEDAASPTQTIFSNNNPDGVGNGPRRPTTLNLARPTFVTQVTTYHWNNGRGTRMPGSISLRSSSGRVYGPWPATGSSGQGGVPNAYWAVTPGVELPAGNYTIVDSDPATWAQNQASGGAGMAWIEGTTR